MLWRCFKYLIGNSILSDKIIFYYLYLHFLVLMRTWPRIVSKHSRSCYAFTYGFFIIIITVAVWNWNMMCSRVFFLFSLQPDLLNLLNFVWNLLILGVATQLWAIVSLEYVGTRFMFVPYRVFSADFCTLETIGIPVQFPVWLTKHKEGKVLWTGSYVTWDHLMLKSLLSGHLLLKTHHHF